jgi:hypothetical protein
MFNECVSDYTILAEYSICSGIAIAEGDGSEGRRRAVQGCEGAFSRGPTNRTA